MLSKKTLNVLSIVAALQSVVAFVVCYYVALNYNIKLKELYFLGVTVNFTLLFFVCFALLHNVYTKAVLLGCSSFFFSLSVTYLIDWIRNDSPALNHVYESLMFSLLIMFLTIITKWTRQLYQSPVKSG